MNKIVIAQQIFNPTIASGATTEFNSVVNSDLNESFVLFPVVYRSHSRLFDSKAIKYYANAFKRIKPDIVVVRGAAIDGLYAILGAKRAKCKCIITGIHGLYSDLVFYSKIKKILAKLVIEKAILKNTSFFYTVCDKAWINHKEFHRFNKKYLGTVYNPMPNYSNCNKRLVREEMRIELGIEDDDVVGIYVGRLTKEKGIDILIEALNDIFPVNKHFKFILVGSCNEVKIQKMINTSLFRDQLLFVGEQKEINKYLFASDYFCFCSLHENHPFSILEACAAGLFVLSTDVGGVFETVVEGLNSFKIPSSTKENVKNVIMRCINEKKYLKDYFDDWYKEKGFLFSSVKFKENIYNLYINALNKCTKKN